MGLSLSRLLIVSHGSLVLLLLIVIYHAMGMTHHTESVSEVEWMRGRAEVQLQPSSNNLSNDENQGTAVAQTGAAAERAGEMRSDQWLLLGLGLVGLGFGVWVTWVAIGMITEPTAAPIDSRRENDQLDQPVYEEAATVEMTHETLPNTSALRNEHPQSQVQARLSESASRSAADIAHGINNLLTVVNGCCYQLRQRVTNDSEAESLISTIEGVTQETARITRQLFSLDRPLEPVPGSLSLKEVKPYAPADRPAAGIATPRGQAVDDREGGAEPRKQ